MVIPGTDCGRPLVDRDLVFSLFGGTRKQALHAYQGMLRRERGAPWLGGRLEMLPWWTSEPGAGGSKAGPRPRCPWTEREPGASEDDGGAVPCAGQLAARCGRP
jgi:hypothetical protein